jgi:hypothetical protein
MKKPEYKPLLYTTTVRNPERYKDFMFVLKKFDKEILNDNIIELFERELFKIGLYRPNILPDSVIEKWSNTKRGEFSDFVLTDEETKEIYDLNDPKKNNNIKGHKDAGFEKGWQTRFNTQFSFMKALGYVYYNIGEEIHISPTGNLIAQSVDISINKNGYITREIINPELERKAYLQAFSKQQRCNPFIRELNDNIPLILLLQVIKKLNSDESYNNCGISYKELPLLIFWKDNDAEKLYRRIKEIRSKYGYSPSSEVIEDICVNEILGGYKKFKLKSIVSEYPDEFVRKMRMTGLISFRGGGRFIDINHNEDEKINYIIEHYSSYRKYTSEKKYFEYMSSIDEKLFGIGSIVFEKTDAAKKLIEWNDIYNWIQIKNELKHLVKNTSSKDIVLKFISAPSRLEFLIALAIKSKLPNVNVIPNYPCDDTGLPISTAGGNKSDIICIENENGILVEVTLLQGRQQTVAEIWPIERHLSDFIAELPNSNCCFIAPTIYSDSQRQIDFVKYSKNLTIKPFSINDFVDRLESESTLYNI